MLQWIIACCVLVVGLACALIGNAKSGKPRNDLAKIRMPWIPIMIFGAFLIVISVTHMAILLTGGRSGGLY